MKYTVVVIHQKALAHYTVSVENDEVFEAYLLRYAGSSNDLPPPRIKFRQEGRHCNGDTDQQDLMDNLHHAVRIEIEKKNSSEVVDPNI